MIEQDETAVSLFSNWELSDKDEHKIYFFRSSSNVIYLIQTEQNTYFLRYAPHEEKTKVQLEAEIELLLYLRNQGFHANEPIACKDGSYVADDGSYYAVLFQGVEGEELDDISLNTDIIKGYGAELARFHQLSAEFNPVNKRNTYTEIIEWIKKAVSGDSEIITYAEKLQQKLDAIPKSKNTYGLCHYDFELDNVFFEPSDKQFEIIDFDDSMYHFYAIDILKAIESIEDETDASEHDELIHAFYQGYQSIIQDLDKSLFPVCTQFIELYSYARLIYSLSELPEQIPDWMEELIDTFKKKSSYLRQRILEKSHTD